MSSDVVIHAEALAKRYDIYERPHHRFLELVAGVSKAREFWAVRDLDLQVRKGETVGIVGRNGSGKSTLLQMICGTLEPTAGQLRVQGRISALLELGAGFNPEFTGRENVYLNAALLGLTRAETDRHLPGIIDFADIGDFLDQPVRTYSSGMYVRLAFAVAIAAEPDILVVDEALAVGDEAFQRKCYARIEQLKSRGVAILFVSHSASAVLQLCDRAVLLEEGRKLLDGAPKVVVGHYQRLIYADPAKRAQILEEIASGMDACAKPIQLQEPADTGLPPPVVVANDVLSAERFDPGLVSHSAVEYVSHGVRIVDPRIETEDGRRVNVLAAGTMYRYRYAVEFDHACEQVHFGMMVKTVSGIELFGMASHPQGEAIPLVEAGKRIEVAFRLRANFLPGTYFLNAGCMGCRDGKPETYLHRILDAVVFRIEMPRTRRRLSGFVDLAEEPACEFSYAG
ncbi:MAG: ABC transporter ATP-binding protein [Rehaibacterium terrae]|uniref:ABC transporter ATP-binding protein n=1 Tax=Rehaibacterium terrae TaxID=1341696 RepID=UPI003918A28E